MSFQINDVIVSHGALKSAKYTISRCRFDIMTSIVPDLKLFCLTLAYMYRSRTIEVEFRHRFTVVNTNDTPVPIGQIHSV